MKVDKMSVSFNPELGDAVLDAWEAERGALTEEELAAAERELRLPASGSSAA